MDIVFDKMWKRRPLLETNFFSRCVDKCLSLELFIALFSILKNHLLEGLLSWELLDQTTRNARAAIIHIKMFNSQNLAYPLGSFFGFW